MGKARNRNKNKTADKNGDGTEKVLNHIDELKPEVLQSKKVTFSENENSSDKTSAHPTIDSSSLDGTDVDGKSEITNGQQRTFQEENAVDRSLAAVQGTWKLWTAVGAVAAVLAVLGHVHVDQAPEELVVEKGVALSQSRAKVFRLVGDLSTYNRWYPGIDQFDATDASPMGIGKHFTELIKIPLYGDVRYDNVVTGYESPRYLSFISNSWLSLRVEIEIERRESSKIPTSLKYRVYARCKTYLMKYVGMPAARLMYTNRVRQAMFNLRLMVGN